MRDTGKLLGLAGVLAAAALAVGCVPALNCGSVPPEPEYTTRLSSTTAATTTRKPFTTHKHSQHTISWEEFSGEYKPRTTSGSRSTSTGTGTYTGTHTGTNTGTGTGTGSGLHSSTHTGSEVEEPFPNHTDMPQTITTTIQPEEPVQTEPPQTAPPETAPPQTAPPQTAPPQNDPPAVEAPVFE